MSAVLAVVAPGLDEADRHWLAEAAEHSRCAGPDGSRVELSDGCGLGHALLAGASPHERQGPLRLGDLRVSGDVRLDDRATLARALRLDPAEHDDAELVLHAIRAWGEAALARLAGDFAFACWDGRTGTLLCARDQIGTTPLHVASVGERLLVASVPDALLLHPAVSDELDEAAVADFLSLGHVSDPRATVFRDVRQLPPAHLLRWQDGRHALRRYWRLPRPDRLSRRDDHPERFRELLDRAVADRLTDDRIATHLSGGIDSPSVAASARAVLGRAAAFRAVTVAGADREELAFAIGAARRLGVVHEVLDITRETPVDPLAPPIVRLSEPTPYLRTPAAWEIATRTAEHARVVLSGHAGDALVRADPASWLDHLLHARLRVVAMTLAEPVRLGAGRPHLHVRPTVQRVRADRPVPVPPALLDRDLIQRTRLAERLTDTHRVPPLRANGVAATIHRDPLWPSLFRAGDPSLTTIPLKTRYPLVDLRLIAFALQLPREPWLVGKRVMRDAARGRLPDDLLARRKSVPANGSVPPLHPGTPELVASTPGAAQFVDLPRLDAAVRDDLAQPGRSAQDLDRALGLVHWLHHRHTDN